MDLDLIGILNPAAGGQRMAPLRIQEVAVLAGNTEELAPVLFLTGGSTAVPNPYPTLSNTAELLPGLETNWVWVQAALKNHADSFDLARSIAAKAWDSEVARIELENASQVEIKSGNPDWDAAFALGQKVGLSLIHGPAPGLAHRSFVSSRNPDQGFSRRGDGLDYEPPWGGQTPLETLYLSRLLLPSEPLLVVGLIKNYLDIQSSAGYTDWKPGLAGQRSKLLATPLLAHLTWTIYRFTEDVDFLEEVYPGLFRFFRSWFEPERDRDRDGIPEWDHVLQTGLEDHPTFSAWVPEDDYIDITTCETASLNAFLFREADAMHEIASRLSRTDDLPYFKETGERLQEALNTSWDSRRMTYSDLDRDTHLKRAESWELLLRGPGLTKVRNRFSTPTRINLKFSTAVDISINPTLSLRGKDHRMRPVTETVGPAQFRWGGGTVTTANAYQYLQEVTLSGLDVDGLVRLSSTHPPGMNLTTLLPLWAEMPGPRRAGAIVRRVIQDPRLYSRPFGLPLLPKTQQDDRYSQGGMVDILWNVLVMEGMLSYGMQQETAEILTRVMEGIVQNLKRYQAFHPRHDAETGEGSGDRNSLPGLPPLGLFLDTLGVRLINPWRVGIYGLNPYPWPVEVRYRGLAILRNPGQTTVTFPDGEMVEVDDPADCIVER
jgi:hypothetical protein